MTIKSRYLNDLFRWREGRQQSNYSKMLLLLNPFVIPFDFYILRYKTGAHVPVHRDTVRRGRHFRINLVLKKAQSGGEFEVQKAIFTSNRLHIFRPDLYEHSVSRIDAGARYVLSIGWILDHKKMVDSGEQ